MKFNHTSQINNNLIPLEYSDIHQGDIFTYKTSNSNWTENRYLMLDASGKAFDFQEKETILIDGTDLKGMEIAIVSGSFMEEKLITKKCL